MIRELAEIEVCDAGLAFEQDVAKAASIFADAEGCHGYELHRSIEHHGRYWLVVLWDAVSDHERFRASDGFTKWRALAGPHFVSAPSVEHLERVI